MGPNSASALVLVLVLGLGLAIVIVIVIVIVLGLIFVPWSGCDGWLSIMRQSIDTIRSRSCLPTSASLLTRACSRELTHTTRRQFIAASFEA
jgi:hypothetical protein